MAKILLVEDVEIVRTVLRRFLESADHEVTECEGGDEATRIIGLRSFDVVVTDLWMKNGDGVEFILAQQAKDRARPILAITGGDPHVTGPKSVEAALRAGATRVLVKPVTKKDILESVEFALRRDGAVADSLQ
jgi:DNA-binding NtrC family response regulator